MSDDDDDYTDSFEDSSDDESEGETVPAPSTQVQAENDFNFSANTTRDRRSEDVRLRVRLGNQECVGSLEEVKVFMDRFSTK